MTILGAVQPAITTQSKTITSIPVTIPAIVPPQNLQLIDPVTKQKKSFTIQNAQQLAELIGKGFELFGKPKGTGTQTVYQNSGFTKLNRFNKKSLMYGALAAGLILMVMLFKKK